MLSQAIERKKEEQKNLLQEIQRINEDNLLAKEQKKEEERLADLRAVEYTRKKLVRKVFFVAHLCNVKLQNRGRLFLQFLRC